MNIEIKSIPEKCIEILDWSTLWRYCCSILKEWQGQSLGHETVSDTCKQH